MLKLSELPVIPALFSVYPSHSVKEKGIFNFSCWILLWLTLLEEFQSLFQILKAILADTGCANLRASKNFRTSFSFFLPLASRIIFAVNSAFHFTISSAE
jgi:hypothetical protein